MTAQDAFTANAGRTVPITDYYVALVTLKARRVLRGGAWNNNPRNLRSANRNHNAPDNRNNNAGMRIASTARCQNAGPVSDSRRATGLSRGDGARAGPRARFGQPVWRRARFFLQCVGEVSGGHRG